MKVSLAKLWLHNYEQLGEIWKQREGGAVTTPADRLSIPIEMEPNFSR